MFYYIFIYSFCPQDEPLRYMDVPQGGINVFVHNVLVHYIFTYIAQNIFLVSLLYIPIAVVSVHMRGHEC
jgi:hypothetical protein